MDVKCEDGSTFVGALRITDVTGWLYWLWVPVLSSNLGKKVHDMNIELMNRTNGVRSLTCEEVNERCEFVDAEPSRRLLSDCESSVVLHHGHKLPMLADN
jgi:hypothetical protein